MGVYCSSLEKDFPGKREILVIELKLKSFLNFANAVKLFLTKLIKNGEVILKKRKPFFVEN